jgi:hypothetical protein
MYFIICKFLEFSKRSEKKTPPHNCFGVLIGVQVGGWLVDTPTRMRLYSPPNPLGSQPQKAGRVAFAKARQHSPVDACCVSTLSLLSPSLTTLPKHNYYSFLE